MFAPSPLLTITIEPGTDRPEVHLHAGGQGFWVARLAATLGAEVTLCCALGGEPGRVLRGLIEAEPIRLMRAAAAGTPNGVYIHDRRGGSSVEVVSVDSRALERHATDELYGIALGAGLDADVTMVTGCQPPDVVDADLYRRLVRDLRANGKIVIADLTGPPLRATLRGRRRAAEAQRRGAGPDGLRRQRQRGRHRRRRAAGCTPRARTAYSSPADRRPRC